MTIRPGHHRPLGTVSTWRFDWEGPLPSLGDVLMQVSAPGANDAEHVRRAYRIVGFLEGRDARHFRLALERIEFEEGLAGPGDGYLFHAVPRG